MSYVMPHPLFKPPPGSTLKEPRLYCKPGEQYAVAEARWRVRRQEYIDVCIMLECLAESNNFYKAFYGLKIMEIIL